MRCEARGAGNCLPELGNLVFLKSCLLASFASQRGARANEGGRAGGLGFCCKWDFLYVHKTLLVPPGTQILKHLLLGACRRAGAALDISLPLGRWEIQENNRNGVGGWLHPRPPRRNSEGKMCPLSR